MLIWQNTFNFVFFKKLADEITHKSLEYLSIVVKMYISVFRRIIFVEGEFQLNQRVGQVTADMNIDTEDDCSFVNIHLTYYCDVTI